MRRLLGAQWAPWHSPPSLTVMAMGNKAQRAHTPWPWRIAGNGVELSTPGHGARVSLTQSGVTHHAGSATEYFAWSSIRELNIELPTATLSGGRALVVLDMIRPIDMSPEEVTVTMTAGYRVAEWDLGRAGHYSWRAGFVLMQLMTLLARDARFSLLAVPGLLDAVMEDVIPRVPAHARLLVRTDLPGLNRHIGGHGAYDGAIERVMANSASSRRS